MADCRMLSKNKNNLNHYFLNGSLVLLYTMTLLFESHGSILQGLSYNDAKCSDAMTCTTCTIKYLCQWSLKQQTCISCIPFNSSSLMVSNIVDCPRISVEKIYHDDKYFINLKYIVKVLKDSVGFSDYLLTNDMYCIRQTSRLKYPVEKKNDEFICSMKMGKLYHKLLNVQSFTEFIFVKFNEVMLRFDYVSDHYVTFHEHDICAFEGLHNCVTCAWNNNKFSNYLKWCTSEYTCEVRKEFYNLNNNAEPPSRYFDYPGYEEVYLTNKCQDVNVTKVDPLSGPQSGGTSVTIVIRNHRILADNRTVMVTVAGTVCTNPRTSGPDTITCTTSPLVNATNGTLKGPVLVKYWSNNAGLTIESSQQFKFDVGPICGTPSPVLDQNQQLSALLSGGIAVAVRGAHFVEPCVVFPARLFIMWPNGTMVFASSNCDPPVNDTYMTCQSPRLDFPGVDERWMLNFGINVMNFTRNQSLFIDGPPFGFSVYLDPVLVDFEIDGAGSVVVNGRHLQHLRPVDILIRVLDPSATDCVVVSLTQKSIVCEPTTPIAPAAVVLLKILVKIGDSLSYTLLNKPPLPNDDPSNLPSHDNPFTLSSWFHAIIALTTSLLFVYALAHCLNTKNGYNLSESIHHTLVDSAE
ncbi:uncharacterized protein LOC111034169 [Myzus persicae]|uniref:uncharacterized protein LOC111034169 n=1 Tax=Myzus persicae TaxID=13164 RepID=UPI000B932F90|nr:uncharacterized protein LOC111034169 [Myzus persicae]XP_022170938.1 uncharacterized protein LOC111034169 [Myzus persicae]XP_022170939.1 uncharacterized protein LOC111034169 [Myzus persicae]